MNGGVVYENIDAPSDVHRGAYEAFYIFFDGYVDSLGHYRDAGLAADFLGGPLQFPVVDVAQSEVCAGFRQLQGKLPTHPLRRAGHQGRHSGERS